MNLWCWLITFCIFAIEAGKLKRYLSQLYSGVQIKRSGHQNIFNFDDLTLKKAFCKREKYVTLLFMRTLSASKGGTMDIKQDNQIIVSNIDVRTANRIRVLQLLFNEENLTQMDIKTGCISVDLQLRRQFNCLWEPDLFAKEKKCLLPGDASHI